MSAGPMGFEPPLILNAASLPAPARWRDAALTVLLWSAWLYMLLAALGALWRPPFVQILLPVDPPEHPWEVVKIALLLVAIAALACTLMLLRVVFERRRFAGDDRRLGFPRPTEAMIARDFGADAAALPAWRQARRIVMHHDAAGRVAQVDVAPPGPQPPR